MNPPCPRCGRTHRRWPRWDEPHYRYLLYRDTTPVGCNRCLGPLCATEKSR